MLDCPIVMCKSGIVFMDLFIFYESSCETSWYTCFLIFKHENLYKVLVYISKFENTQFFKHVVGMV